MQDRQGEIDNLIKDFLSVKRMIMRKNGVLKYLAFSKAFRSVVITSGIFVTLYSLVFYWVTNLYGSFELIPGGLRAFLFVILISTILLLVIFKINTILKAAKDVNSSIDLPKLINEVYSREAILQMVPYILTIIFSIIFLQSKGQGVYLPQVLAVLLGFMCNSLVNIFYIIELHTLSYWLIITSLLTIPYAGLINPAITVVITFGLGLIFMGIFGYNFIFGEGE